MSIIQKIFNKMKDRKGVTGADVAAALTVIVLTVGIVTAIYVNAINQSKDNIRYANAVRIATNIMENIQKSTYETVKSTCNSSNSKEVNGKNEKLFETKIPNGFKATVTLSSASTPDIARDVTINVRYKASMSYKTVTLKSVKEKELMDMTNPPDLSLVPGYNDATKKYIYPVNKSGSNYVVTTTNDINWYNYASNKRVFALVWVTTSAEKNINDTASGDIYAWIPRYVPNGSGVQYLYGTSKLPITMNLYGNIYSYGITSSTTNSSNSYVSGSFTDNDGLSGIWYKISGESSSSKAYKACKGLTDKINPTNFTKP